MNKVVLITGGAKIALRLPNVFIQRHEYFDNLHKSASAARAPESH